MDEINFLIHSAGRSGFLSPNELRRDLSHDGDLEVLPSVGGQTAHAEGHEGEQLLPPSDSPSVPVFWILPWNKPPP